MFTKKSYIGFPVLRCPLLGMLGLCCHIQSWDDHHHHYDLKPHHPKTVRRALLGKVCPHLEEGGGHDAVLRVERVVHRPERVPQEVQLVADCWIESKILGIGIIRKTLILFM